MHSELIAFHLSGCSHYLCEILFKRLHNAVTIQAARSVRSEYFFISSRLLRAHLLSPHLCSSEKQISSPVLIQSHQPASTTSGDFSQRIKYRLLRKEQLAVLGLGASPLLMVQMELVSMNITFISVFTGVIKMSDTDSYSSH